MVYQGQIHALRVMIEADWDTARLAQAFNDAYREKFGNTLDNMPVAVVNLRTVVVGQRSSAALPQRAAAAGGGTPVASSRRPVHFNAWYDTPVYQRDALTPGMQFNGPAIVEQSDTTTVIEPDMVVTVDARSNLLAQVK